IVATSLHYRTFFTRACRRRLFTCPQNPARIIVHAMPPPKDGAGAASRAPDSHARDSVRQPAVAGMFYPRERASCLAEAQELMQRGRRAAEDALKQSASGARDRRILGA